MSHPPKFVASCRQLYVGLHRVPVWLWQSQVDCKPGSQSLTLFCQVTCVHKYRVHFSRDHSARGGASRELVAAETLWPSITGCVYNVSLTGVL